MKIFPNAFLVFPPHTVNLVVRFGVRLVRLWSDLQTSLNDSKIRNLKPSSRPVKLSDSHGLYLLVNPGSSRIWYLKYRFSGKESRVSLGAYPLISLAEAKQKRDDIRKLLAQNINPAQQRLTEKPPRQRKSVLKLSRGAGIKSTKSSRLIMPRVFSPAWKIISFRPSVICPSPR